MLKKISTKREGLSVSLKHTHEIMASIKGRKIDDAVKFLEDVRNKKAYVPFKKYPSKGHRGGVPAGYPIKASGAVIRMLKELKANAKVVSGGEDNIPIGGYDLGRGGYPRFSSGKVYKHGKRTNLTIFASVEQTPKPADENKKEEVKENVTQEANKQ